MTDKAKSPFLFSIQLILWLFLTIKVGCPVNKFYHFCIIFYHFCNIFGEN